MLTRAQWLPLIYTATREAYVLQTKWELNILLLDSRRVLVGTTGTKGAGIR